MIYQRVLAALPAAELITIGGRMTDKTGNRGIGDNLIKSPTNADHKLIYEYTSDALHVAVAFIQKLIIRNQKQNVELNKAVYARNNKIAGVHLANAMAIGKANAKEVEPFKKVLNPIANNENIHRAPHKSAKLDICDNNFGNWIVNNTGGSRGDYEKPLIETIEKAVTDAEVTNE